jgi:hypothetical protein
MEASVLHAIVVLIKEFQVLFILAFAMLVLNLSEK